MGSLSNRSAIAGQATLTLPGLTNGSMAFSPDGHRLATANGDNTARIYPASIETLLVLARSRLTRTWTPGECLRYLQLETCPARP